MAHKDLREAKNNASFQGARYVGNNTNQLTAEFKAYLADKRKGRKSAMQQVKMSANQLAIKAFEGTNEVTLQSVNRMTRPPTSYIKKASPITADRPQREYLRREEVRAKRAARNDQRAHTTLLTKSERIRRNDARIREKKSSRGAKPIPEYLFGKQRKGASATRVGDSKHDLRKAPAPLLPVVTEHTPSIHEAASLLQIEEWLGETGAPPSEEAVAARLLNEAEQMF